MLIFGRDEADYVVTVQYFVAKQKLWLGFLANYVVYTDAALTNAVLEISRTPLSWTQYFEVKRIDGGVRHHYCLVQANWLVGFHCRRFVLDFANFQCVVIDNNHCPYTDTIYKDTRLRFCGTSTVESEHGVDDFTINVLEDDELGMLDGMLPVWLVPSTPLLTVANVFFTGLKRRLLSIWYAPSVVEQVLAADRPRRVLQPLGRYHKLEKPLCDKVRLFKLDSVFELCELRDSSPDLALLSILMVLKQQERERFPLNIPTENKAELYRPRREMQMFRPSV